MSPKKISFLADESVEYSLVKHIRTKGFDVLSVAEDSASLDDKKVLSRAYKTRRILLTNDKDFGDLVYLSNLPHEGIVLFRLKSEYLVAKIRAFDRLIELYADKLKNAFIVVDDANVRIRT